MPRAEINGVDIYFEQHGESGEPLVLMHGYTGDITDWRFQAPEFSRTHRVVMMDHRGHGRSDAPKARDAYTIDQMARDVEALLDMLELQRYHLVGHSMGGAIAQEMALRSPGRLMSLTLHDTSHSFSWVAENTNLAVWRDYRFKIAESVGMAAVAELDTPFPPPPHMPAERLAETKLRLAAMSVDAFIGAWHGVSSWQGEVDRLHEISARTLVVYGDLDNGLIIEGSRRLAATIPGATLEVVPETGHSPQYERPELFNAALRRHLERAGGSTAK